MLIKKKPEFCAYCSNEKDCTIDINPSQTKLSCMEEIGMQIVARQEIVPVWRCLWCQEPFVPKIVPVGTPSPKHCEICRLTQVVMGLRTKV